ncbi:MAG: ABC transporter [Candidatus Entotheonella factor]|uniref:ABC transporter n=3 Tax=Candidatus Entotheonella TaxID=93171 RepID=W4LFT9_ENTF1|nr:MAG: ABC transporter [Candidatus Entotheonella factor]
MSLKLEHITKTVGAEMHIDDLDLELESGGFNVLLGRTLAGKTTLMRLMAGLDRPTSGRVLMDGQDVTKIPVQARKVAMVYQQFINYPSLTVYRNIASPLKLAGLSKPEIDRKVREAAEMMHITPLLNRLPSELSGGQQQRTAMARALVKEANLLLFDEPLVNLDYKLREELRFEMREIFKQRQAVAVYATTEPLEALSLGGSVAVLDEGKLLQFGPTVEVFHHPASVRVGEIFSDPPINVLPGNLGDEMLLLGHDIQAPRADHFKQLHGGTYQFGLRANHLHVTPHADSDVEVKGEVDLAEISGSETFIHVRHGDSTLIVQQDGAHEFHTGTPITVYLDPHRLFAFDAEGNLAAAPTRTS